MATTADKVITVLELRDGDFNARVQRNEQAFIRAKSNEARAAEMSERRIVGAQNGIKTALLASAATIGAAFSASAVANLADGYTRFTNQLKVAGLEGAALARTQQDLYGVAQKYGVQLEVLGRLYGGLSVLQRDLNTTGAESLSLTTAVAQAVKINGSSVASASGAILGLNQALAQVKVQSDEYNQILDGARPLLLAAVQASDRYGGSLARLKQDIEAGKVSGADLFKILQGGFPTLAEQAEKASLTIGNSFQILNNALGLYVGQTDQALSATERMSQGIQLLANNLDTIVPVMLVLIGLVGTRYVAGAVAATGATLAKAGADALAAQNARAHALAVAAQSAANARLVASGGAATAALRYQAAASLTAAGAARAAGASLLAMAGGPVGVAIIAVAALAAGLIYLNNKYADGAAVSRALAESQRRTATAIDAYREAAIKATTATGEQAKAARDAASAANIHAIREIRRAQALAISTEQIYRNRAALAALAATEATRQGPRDPGEVGGSLAFAGGAQANADRAQQQAAQAKADVEKAKADYAQLRADIAAGTLTGGAGGRPPAEETGRTRRGRAATGLSEEEKADLREQINLQRELALARAQGNDEAERAAQRRLDILSLTDEMERAGVANAQAAATAQVDALATQEAINREIDKLLEQSERRNEARADAKEREEAALDRQLETQLALARLEGNEALVRLLERELALRQAIAGLGPNATPDEIAVVRDDQAAIGDAEDVKRQKDQYREYARIFVDSIREADSLGEFFTNLGGGLADKLADRLAERLENDIADLLAQLFSKDGPLGGIFNTGVAGMGGGGGGEGSGWGGLMSTIGSLFGGRRAMGGPVKKGRFYKVNENTANSEYFTPGTDGYISPSNPGTARGGGGGGGPTELNVSLENNTGVPMRVVDKGSDNDGGRRLALEPVMDEALTGAARSGAWRRAERQKKQPVMRG